jgi:FtsP/CotA-like multicopper oxidase with cupredoxin domain
MDGVPSLTQCPIAPGESYTYKWRAEEYGSGWYHSHFYVQAWDGFFGGIIINGPATANYGVDLGHIFLNDWYHSTADELVLEAATSGPPTAINGLINGTNTYNDTMGSRFETKFEAGVRYRIRLVNAAADNHFRFMIDSHTMEVIATDFVPINPYTTTDLSVGMGQRYDIIVEAKNITSGNFWLRAIPQESCSETSAKDDIKGIIRYDNSSTADPTTTAYSYTDSCLDEDPANLIPYLSIEASDSYGYHNDTEVAVQVITNALQWTMNKTSFRTAWENPTLLQVAEGATTFSTKQQVIQFPKAGQWVYLIIHSPFAQNHPMHLYGHDFWVLDAAYGNFVGTVEELNVSNKPRRDTVMMPASGYVVIAFPTKNPWSEYR